MISSGLLRWYSTHVIEHVEYLCRRLVNGADHRSATHCQSLEQTDALKTRRTVETAVHAQTTSSFSNIYTFIKLFTIGPVYRTAPRPPQTVADTDVHVKCQFIKRCIRDQSLSGG